MAANSRTASAAQILCVMAYLGEGTTSQVIAGSLQTNPVVVRRLLKSLALAGLVELRPGKDGGVNLVCAPDDITLEQVHAAVEGGTGMFALRPAGNPNCRVNKAMPKLLKPIFESADAAAAQILSETTIGSLARAIA
jgi:DNA-binding IscR family transcriptional regulator